MLPKSPPLFVDRIAPEVGIKEVSENNLVAAFVDYGPDLVADEIARAVCAERPLAAKLLPMCPE